MVESFTRAKKIRLFNNVLSLIVIMMGVYIILSPVLPWLSYNIAQSSGGAAKTISPENISQAAQKGGNWLLAPKAGIEEPILEGQSLSTVHKGAWRRPNSSTPPVGSNTVITGHRFGYFGNTKYVFYNLDKLEVGDEISVIWEKENFIYKVKEVKIVPPTATYIEDSTEGSLLTLYTCTPILTATDRLVVTATLSKVTDI